ncbi:hypothetical protein VTK56DRAFT_5205 [Thermocarpiscus australiensis]
MTDRLIVPSRLVVESGGGDVQQVRLVGRLSERGRMPSLYTPRIKGTWLISRQECPKINSDKQTPLARGPDFRTRLRGSVDGSRLRTQRETGRKLPTKAYPNRKLVGQWVRTQHMVELSVTSVPCPRYFRPALTVSPKPLVIWSRNGAGNRTGQGPGQGFAGVSRVPKSLSRRCLMQPGTNVLRSPACATAAGPPRVAGRRHS